jgi:hypothetical protein
MLRGGGKKNWDSGGYFFVTGIPVLCFGVLIG